MITSGLKTNRLWLGSVAACAAMFASVANATTYYVSNSGNDSNNGTSQGTAWKTAAKVNAAVLAAGDQVLFERGGTWRERLAPTSSGAAGNPITFADYGSGNKPIFYGSDVLTNASFTSLGGNSYSYNVGPNVSTTYCYLLQDHAFVGTGPAAYGSPNITVTLTTDPRTDGKLYTFCTRANEIYSNSRNHLVFRNLVAQETAANPDGASMGYGIRAEWSTDVLFENCEALQCGYHNFGCINADQVTLRGCRAAYVAPGVPDNSLYVTYADNGLAATSSLCVYDNCTADNQSGHFFFVSHSAYSKGLHVVFQNCTFPAAMGKVNCMSDTGAAFAFTNCTLMGGRLELFAPNTTIDGVTFKNNAFIDMYSASNIVQNCIFDNVGNFESAAILMRGGYTVGERIRFNTFYVPIASCMGFKGSTPDLKFYGNIFAGLLIDTGNQPGNASDVTYADYNLYFPTPTTVMGQNWATWTGSGEDAHSKTVDPLFNNAGSGDYTLQASSQAIDAAATTNQIPDHDVTQTAYRPQGTAADMGAYERDAGPTIPVITSPTNATAIMNHSFTTYWITARGTPTSFDAGVLPSGLSVNHASGQITGTPMVSGTFAVTISASNALGIGQATLTLTIKVPGSMVGSGAAGTTATVNLTTEGTDDWAHWGFSGTTMNHKSVSGNAVNHITETHVGSAAQYNNNANGYTWTDGTPTANATASTTGIYIQQVGNGFTITVPADRTTRTVTLYLGGYLAAGAITAHISDDSAPDYVDRSFSNLSGSFCAVYTITYQAGAASQHLTVTWLVDSGLGGGNVTLQAATLQGGGASPEEIMFVPAGMSAGPTGCSLSWSGATGPTNDFKVYRNTNLVAGSWQVVAPNIVRSGTGTNLWTDTNVFPQAFYRVAAPNQ